MCAFECVCVCVRARAPKSGPMRARVCHFFVPLLLLLLLLLLIHRTVSNATACCGGNSPRWNRQTACSRWLSEHHRAQRREGESHRKRKRLRPNGTEQQGVQWTRQPERGHTKNSRRCFRTDSRKSGFYIIILSSSWS